MRLICPNCDAQYEVPDNVIPDEGRDVQCSNCGHTWWQYASGHAGGANADVDELGRAVVAEDGAGPAHMEQPPEAPMHDDDAATDAPVEETPVDQIEVEDDPQTDLQGDDAAEDDAEEDVTEKDTPESGASEDEENEADITVAEAARNLIRAQGGGDLAPEGSESEAEHSVDAGAAAEDHAHDDADEWLADASEDADTADEDADDDDDASEDEEEVAPSSGLDPEVARILKEEAAFEARAREADTLETQPDLGIEENADSRADETRRRMARLRGETDPAETAAVGASAAATTRGDMLPDIEEINSTLRSSAQEPEAVEAEERQKRRGFKLGFTLIILLALIAILAYALAPQISEMVPALAEPLASYVDAINSGRIWLDAQMEGLLERLDSSEPTTGDATSN